MAVQQFEYHPEPGDGLVPSWSGSFQELPQDGVGVLMVHVGDTRTHPFPDGWSPVSPEPIYDDDVELWVCVRR